MWIKITTTDGAKHIVNESNLMDAYYSEESDLTIINFSRSAYPAIYVKGNIVPELTKVIGTKYSVATIMGKDG